MHHAHVGSGAPDCFGAYLVCRCSDAELCILTHCCHLQHLQMRTFSIHKTTPAPPLRLPSAHRL